MMEKTAKNGDNSLLFYQIMNYPVPKLKELFFLISDFRTKELENNYKTQDEISFDNIDRLNQFVEHINKFWWIYRAIPFVKNIYLCNSITFNWLKDTSDIDLFFVVKKWKLWTARFVALFLFSIFGLRWYKTKKYKKFDLWFFITDENLNLYPYTIKPFDIYFVYWIAHLVPLYSQVEWTENDIFLENKWIKNLLQNHPLNTVINIWNKHFVGNNWYKNLSEKILNWFLGKWIERLIKYLWMPIVLHKKNKLGKAWAWIVITPRTLKFYWSKVRKIVNYQFNFLLKHQEKDKKH